MPRTATHLAERLGLLERELLASGDSQTGQKMSQLLSKAGHSQVRVAFCGHFSAGKSSMLNRLLGEPILPSSPIPTTAKVVTLHHGRARLEAEWEDGSTSVWEGLEALKDSAALFKDGSPAKNLRLYYPSPLLEEGLILMDTPGIDSNEEAHQLATHSALHLADVVMMVMDYNHVLAERNLEFVRLLSEKGKAVYLVVNQIDKHLSFELPFAQYQEHLRQSLEQWGIRPYDVFYTSLKVMDHPLNQWERLVEQLRRFSRLGSELVDSSLALDAGQLLEEHRLYLTRQGQEQTHEWEQRLKQAPEGWREQYRELQERLQQSRARPEAFLDEAESELEDLLKNAPIMPYEVREAARQYLMARQQREQARWRKGKRMEEEQKALQAFWELLSKEVEAHLDWHIKTLLIQVTERFGLRDESWQQQVNRFAVHLEPGMLSELAKSGVMSESYFMNYAQDVVQAVVSAYRRQARLYLLEAAEHLRKAGQGQESQWEAEMEHMSVWVQAEAAIASQRQEVEEKIQRLYALLWEGQSREEVLQERERLLMAARLPVEAPPAAEVTGSAVHPAAPEAEAPPVAAAAEQSPAETERSEGAGRLKEVAALLEEAAESLMPLEPMQGAAASLRQRAERMRQRRFTVALFGAFSAGKSSFGNAVLGARILPVSPNPTTATINLIQQPDEEHTHGQVLICFKKEEDLLSEIRESALRLGLPWQEREGIASLKEKLASLSLPDLPPASHPHLAFLHAVAKGWEQWEEHLGSQMLVGLGEYQEFVAQEEKACFVDRIHLFWDCSFTRQGMVLVDTPGADSVNARHTQVAFQYLKEADAFFYVTYYMHSFSRADRQFLTQMGNVRAAKEMDNLFIILNAMDMAHSREELDGVMSHLRQELAHHGLHQPRLYPVSSLLALLAKRSGSQVAPNSEEQRLLQRLLAQVRPLWDGERDALGLSGFLDVEQGFREFVVSGLTPLAIRHARTELVRLTQRLEEWLAMSRQDGQVRERLIGESIEREQQVLRLLDEVNSDSAFGRLQTEAQELFYYVKDRLLLKLPEMLQHHVGHVQGEGAQGRRQLLLGLEQMLQEMSDELGHEMRATSLRLERYLGQELSRLQERSLDEAAAIDPQLAWAPVEVEGMEMPDIPQALPLLRQAPLQPLAGIYKNSRQFYEREGLKRLKEEVQASLEPLVARYLEQQRQSFEEHYVHLLRVAIQDWRERAKGESRAYYQGVREALQDTSQAEIWEQAFRKLSALSRHPALAEQ